MLRALSRAVEEGCIGPVRAPVLVTSKPFNDTGTSTQLMLAYVSIIMDIYTNIKDVFPVPTSELLANY